MQKIKYLFKRIIELDYKNMMRIAGSVSKKSGKFFPAVVIDMMICGLKYQAGYYDYQEFEFYNLNSEQRKTYLTRGKNNEIIRRFNDKSKFHIFENKDEFHAMFKEFTKRDWLKLDGNNANDFVSFLEKNQQIIVKPVAGEGGEGIRKCKYTNREDAEALYGELMANGQNLAEQYIVQNKEFDKLYSGSVNSLRVYSFIENGNVHILQMILKIGNGGIVDNFSGGGMYTFVDEKGYVCVGAIDKADNVFHEHPITKARIKDFKIPLYEKIAELIDGAARVVPEVAYVGWDVAVGENEAMIIEGNCFPGVFQIKPSLNEKKEGVIPKYDKVMGIFGYIA